MSKSDNSKDELTVEDKVDILDHKLEDNLDKMFAQLRVIMHASGLKEKDIKDAASELGFSIDLMDAGHKEVDPDNPRT
jgi:hypothetical protein